MPSTRNRSLTAAERETVIIMDDERDIATVSTHQRRLITRLERNPLAVKIGDLTYGTTVGAKFELPAWSVSFRTKHRRATSTSGQGFSSASPALEQESNAKDPVAA